MCCCCILRRGYESRRSAGVWSFPHELGNNRGTEAPRSLVSPTPPPRLGPQIGTPRVGVDSAVPHLADRGEPAGVGRDAAPGSRTPVSPHGPHRVSRIRPRRSAPCSWRSGELASAGPETRWDAAHNPSTSPSAPPAMTLDRAAKECPRVAEAHDKARRSRVRHELQRPRDLCDESHPPHEAFTLTWQTRFPANSTVLVTAHAVRRRTP